MADTKKYGEMYTSCGSMYSFLIAVNKEVSTKCPGSCTQNRYTFSQGSNKTMWNNFTTELLSLCQLFYEKDKICSRQQSMFDVASTIIQTLTKSKSFSGVGAMGAVQFVQLAALTGLIPLCCYNYAELKSMDLGPAKFIKEAFEGEGKQDEGKEAEGNDKRKINITFCQSKFIEIFKELKNIWGVLITLAILENLLCELFCCITSTRKKTSKSDKVNRLDCVADMPMSEIKESRIKDIIFYDEQRKCVQNFFWSLRYQRKHVVSGPNYL